jgi:hypothetical protein
MDSLSFLAESVAAAAPLLIGAVVAVAAAIWVVRSRRRR